MLAAPERRRGDVEISRFVRGHGIPWEIPRLVSPDRATPRHFLVLSFSKTTCAFGALARAARASRATSPKGGFKAGNVSGCKIGIWLSLEPLPTIGSLAIETRSCLTLVCLGLGSCANPCASNTKLGTRSFNSVFIKIAPTVAFLVRLPPVDIPDSHFRFHSPAWKCLITGANCNWTKGRGGVEMH